MELDKIAYITLACLTGLIIILVIAFGTYGSNISKDPSFIMFFKWYIFLFVFNLFNILVTLIFHYIMADIPGEKGLKGFTGDRGLPGESSKCFCSNVGGDASYKNITQIDLNKNIHTRDVEKSGDRVGTIIYDGTKTDTLTIEHENAIQKLAEATAAAKAEAATLVAAAAEAKVAAAGAEVAAVTEAAALLNKEIEYYRNEKGLVTTKFHAIWLVGGGFLLDKGSLIYYNLFDTAIIDPIEWTYLWGKIFNELIQHIYTLPVDVLDKDMSDGEKMFTVGDRAGMIKLLNSKNYPT